MDSSLHERLYNNEINKENLTSLLKEYNPDQHIAFIGSGINTTINDIPNYSLLFNKLCNGIYNEKDNNKINPDSFSRLYENYNDIENFDRKVFDIITPKNTSGSMTSIDITRAFNCFVTTNYHEPIEEAFKKKQIIAQESPAELKLFYFSFPTTLGQPSKHTLTYLHGNSAIGFCILRQKDYEYFYPSLYQKHLGVYVLENSLFDIFTKKSVVFLGCSLEKHIKEYLNYLINKKINQMNQKINREKKLICNTHYWINNDIDINQYLRGIPKQEKENKYKEYENKYFENFARIKIKPIIYTGYHIFIEDICKLLIHKGEDKKTLKFEQSFDPTKGV